MYLCHSLSLSYSSIALYRSMLSGVFHFILPELSFHFVLHDLLRSFRLERPLPSSHVPPWGLLLVLCFLRGPPFEHLSSCSLWDLTQKVLFLLSLATARRVDELQAVSRDVSFSDSDLYLSYLPEFRTKTESLTNPLPRSFCVRSLSGFVGDLPDELLCPVRAVRVYLSRVSSLSSSSHSFVSPRSPSQSLSKNALSCFLHDVISRVYSSASVSSSSSLPSSSASSFREHSVVGLQLLGLFLVTLLFLLSWRLLLGLLLLSLLPSTSRMFRSPRLVVLVWVLWWRLVILYNLVMGFYNFLGFWFGIFMLPFSAGSGAPWEGVAALRRLLRFV